MRFSTCTRNLELKLQVAKESEERLKSHQGMLLNHYGKAGIE
jgi:hypothetical protein